MSSIKTAISIPESLYHQASDLAQEMNIPRSQLFAKAMEEYLRRHRAKQLLESVNEAYEDGLDDSEKVMLEGMRLHQRQLQSEE